MKKLLILMIPFLFLCGCTHDMNKKEIDEIDLVLVLGIDYEDGDYIVSALYTNGGGADAESESAPETLVQGKGSTPYEAISELKLKNQKAITLAHTGNFLIGSNAAKNGLQYTMDFLSRDETIKMQSLIFVIKGMSAQDFMNQAIENKQTIHEDLEAIEQKQHELVTRNDNSLVNILNEMKQSYSSVLIPYIVAEENSFLLEGYAVFNELKLVDYLDKDTSSGVNFIKNIIKSYPILLDNGVGLSLSYSNTTITSKLKNNGIMITIKTDFETMIREIYSNEDIFTRDKLSELTDMQNLYIKKVIETAVNYSLNTGLDIFQLARFIENQHVKEWDTYKEDWIDRIEKIQYEYVINSEITKSFILGNVR